MDNNPPDDCQCTIYQCWANPVPTVDNCYQDDDNTVCNPCPCPSLENYRPPSMAAGLPPVISSSRGGKYRDDTPKTINMSFVHLSKPVFNKQNRSNSRSSGGKLPSTTRIKGAKPVSLGRRSRREGARSGGAAAQSGRFKSKKSAKAKNKGKSKSSGRRGPSGGRKSGRKSPKGKAGSTRGRKSAGRKRGGKSANRGKDGDGDKVRGRSKTKKKGQSKGSSRSTSRTASPGSSKGSKKSRKKQRGRSKKKSGKRKPRGPPPTPVNVDQRKSDSTLATRLEMLNIFCLLNPPDKIQRVTELRGYSSEPELPLPCQFKFALKKATTKQPVKCNSAEDVMLKHRTECPELLLHPCEAEDTEGAEFDISPSCWNKWRDVFESERNRYSFFDELYRKKYITDSMEVPGVPDDVSYLIEADNEHYSSKIDYGRIVLKTKHVYTGNFHDWYFHGPGRYVWLDGKIYQGDFVNGVMHGEGTFVWPDGSIYEGEFQEGARRGQGLYTTPQGYIYSGDWNEGVPHGRGKIWYDIDGNNYYDGSIQNGNLHGFGTRQYKNGDRYVGNWEDGKQNGSGTMLWRDIDQMYRGQWSDGKPHGEGIQVWYRFRDNSQQGSKTKTQSWRNIFKGTWKAGQRDGKGKLFFPNGAIFEGNWKDGKQVPGEGKYADPSGELLFGLSCAQPDKTGLMEEIFERPIYECLFNMLINSLAQSYPVKKESNGITEAQTLADVCFKYMTELQLLYKRACVLGSLWSGNIKLPKSAHNCNSCFKNAFNFSSPKGNMYLELNKKMSPDKFPVTRFGLWLLIGDCEDALKYVTMAHYDKIWRTASSICFQAPYSPFEPVYFWQFIQCLIMVAWEQAVSIPLSRSKIKYKCTKDGLQLPVGATLKEEKFINGKADSEDRRKSTKSKKKTKRMSIKKKGKNKKKSINANSMNKSSQETETTNEPLNNIVEDTLKVNLSDDDFIDIPPADDGALARPPSALLEVDAQTETAELLGELDSSEEDIFEPGDDKGKCELTSVANIFERFMADYIPKCFNRLPGQMLPNPLDRMPSLVDMFDQFTSINESPIITGREFLQSILKDQVHPCSEIFWNRLKEVLASSMDYKHLLSFAQKLSLITPSKLKIMPLEMSDSDIDSEVDNGPKRDSKSMHARGFSYAGSIMLVPKASALMEEVTREAIANTIINGKSEEFPGAVKSQIATPKSHTSDGILAHKSNHSETRQTGRVSLGKMAEEPPKEPEPTHDPETGIRYCLPEDELVKEDTQSNDETKEMGLLEQEKIFDIEQELLKPDGASWGNEMQRTGLNLKSSLSSSEVVEVLRKLYPELCGAEDMPNISFEMAFCDWLWALLLCLKTSVMKEQVDNPAPQLYPKRTLPASTELAMTLPNTSLPYECDLCSHHGDPAKTFNEIILPAFMRHEQLRCGDVAIARAQGTRGFNPVENRALHSTSKYSGQYVATTAMGSKKSVAI